MIVPSEALSPSSQTFWLRLGTAVLCGGAIGFERQRRGKVAGVRTSVLICLGTEIFVALGASSVPANVDPTRVLGQVVTGIGFLGAGVILSREGRILGVTTAAVIWVLAALGALIGFGYLSSALIVTLVTLGVLIGFPQAEIMLSGGSAQRASGQMSEIERE